MATTTNAPNRVTAPGPHRGVPRRRRWLLAIVVAIVLVAGLLAQHLVSEGGSSGPGGTEASPPSASIPAPLELGTATADEELATREVAGVPRGFPQTVDGAVEALAAATGFLRIGGADQTPADRDLLLQDLGYREFPDTPAEVANIQRYYKLNADGQPMTGEPGDRFYSDCLPQYGMYNTQRITPSASSPTSVAVSIWMPCIEGTGSPSHIDNLRIQWDWYSAPMIWRDGDWRVAMQEMPTNPSPPVPEDKLRPNVSVAERAQLVSGTPRGFWKLFRDYSEQWPTELLGPDPKEASK